MYHGNILAFICKYFFSKKAYYFLILNSICGYMNEKYIMNLNKYNSYLSKSNFLNKIIYNSLVVKYSMRKSVISKRKGIINDFDTDKFKTNSNQK